MDTNNRTCFSNATKYLVRRMPELKEEVVADFVFSAEQLQSHVFLEAIWSQHMPAARVMTEQVASTLALDHIRHISSGVLSGQAMAAPTVEGHQIGPPYYRLSIGATSHYGIAVSVHLLREAVLGVCSYDLQFFDCMVEVSMDFSCSL